MIAQGTTPDQWWEVGRGILIFLCGLGVGAGFVSLKRY